MNGSRSNNSGYGGKTSLDQLNRTIEGLEARIQGLVSERRHAPPRPQSNAVDEIIERQRALAARERVSAVMERAPRPEPEVRYHEEPRHMPEPRPAPLAEPDYSGQIAQQSSALGEIAATLSALRAELKQGIGSEKIAYGLDEIRSDMRSLKTATASSHGSADLVRDELARLGDSIDRLGAGSQTHAADDLRAELEDLRAMAAGFAREDSLRRLENRWDRTEAKLAGIDQDALKEELVQLAWRIDDLKSGLGQLSAAPAVRALEDKLIGLAASIEGLGRNIEASTDFSHQFGGLDRRLDEISRAIAASAAQTAASTDTAAFHRLEDRIAELTAHVDMLQAPSNQESEVAARIEALTERIEDLANEDAALRLEERIGQLSKMIERNFREASQQPEVSSHLADISRKIDGLNGPTDALLDRLDFLARRLDDLEQPAPVTAPAFSDTAAISRLENRLSHIAARLDESVAAPAADGEALANLERQIASLSELLNQPGSAPAANPPFAHQIAAIEDYMAASDEFIVEAARQAAEAVVEAYSRSNMGGASASAADISAFASLAEDLRALEAHTRSSEERTAETFSALHQTLVQIASRLDDLGERATVQPARVAQETVREREPVREREVQAAGAPMPRAAQPEFAPVAAPVQDAAPEVMRAPPRQSKVDVLQDVDLMEGAAEADLAADNAEVPANDVPREKPASKSLIAGLAARLMPGKKEKPAARLAVDPAPSLDAGPMIVAEDRDDGMLIEPGSGVPDVKKIMDKVRASQKTGAMAAKPGTGSQADVIAAARRAAQAAAQEAGAQKFVQPAVKGRDKGGKPAKPAKESKSIFGAPGETRRPILLAAAAVLLVVMSYPLVSDLISSRHQDTAAEQPQAVESVPADAANMSATADPSAQPDLQRAETASQPVDSGAKTLMAPVTDTKNASTLQKPGDAAPVDDKAAPVMDAAKPADAAPMDAAPADAAPVDAGLAGDKAATAETPSSTRSVPANDVSGAADPAKDKPVAEAPAQPSAELAAAPLPAGLAPASLVEAVKKGDALAYFEVGSRYTDGRNGMKVDLAQAAKWYGMAADKGFAPAEYRLASFLEKGTGVTRDIGRAQALYRAAADKGNASAMHNLAVLYATGASAAGTPDFGQAAHWFESAANLNIRDSQFNLAILYARGSGVKQDLTESYKWFGIAAKQGDQDAAQKRDEVANAMSAEQLKDAKAKLDLWAPKALNIDVNTPLVPDEWVAKSNTTASIDMKRAIRNIQAILNNNGFDAGKPDGELGKKTVLAIKSFQKSVGLEPSGRIDDALIRELLKRNKKG